VSLGDTEVRDMVFGHDIKRDDPLLIQVIAEMGDACNCKVGGLKIIEIPAGVEWEVRENGCGEEYIAEKHRTWS
jgi:hypothetical protein